MEEIRVDNIIMKNIGQQAVVLDMEYSKMAPEPVSERTPKFRNIHFSNITGETKDAIYINGLAEMPVEDISFNDIQFVAQRGAIIKEASNIELHNVRITAKEGPSLSAENVKGLVIDGVKTMTPVPSQSCIDLKNVEDVFIYNCQPVKGTDLFIHLAGDRSKNVVLKNNNWFYALKPLVKESYVKENIVVE